MRRLAFALAASLIAATAHAAAVTWNGSISTEWNTGGNWSSSSPPTSLDDVTIPANVASGRYPVVGTATASALTVTLASGAGTPPSLTVSADSLVVAGNFTVNAGTVTHSGGRIKVTAGAISITGTLNESGGTWLSAVTLTVNNGGNVNVSGTGVLHLASGLATTPTDAITIAAGGTITQSGGSVDVRDFTTTAGTPNGTYNQSSGTFKLYHDFKSSGTFNATGGTVEFAAAGGGGTWPSTTGPTQFFNVLNSVDPDFDGNAGVSFGVAGDWTSNAAVNLSGQATTVTFNGTGAQTIGGSASTTFRNVTVTKTSGTVTLGAGQTVTGGNLTVTAGTLDLSSYTFNRSASGGVLTVSNGATLKTANAFPTNFATVTLGATSTVEFYGSGAQTIPAYNYGHLTSSSSGARTLASSGTLGVAGTLTPGTNSYTVTGSTVDFNGSGAQAISLQTFNHLTLSNSGTKTFASGTTMLTGNLTVSGSATADATTNSAAITLNGGSGQSIPGITFYDLTVNNASGVTITGDATINHVLTFTAGRITTNANTVILAASGSVSRSSGHVVGNLRKNVATGATSRTFEVGDASNYTPVSVAFSSVETAGDLTARVTSGDHPSVASSGIRASMSVNRYWTLTNSGIAFTDYSATFTFVAGDIDAGATPSIFIVGDYSGGAWSHPVVGERTSTTTQITGASSFSEYQIGEATTLTWTGAVSTEWNTGGNWNSGLIPTSADVVTIPANVASGRYPVVGTATANVATLTLGSGPGTPPSLTVSADSLVVAGSLTVNAGTATLSGGRIKVTSGAVSVTGTLAVSGGTFLTAVALTVNNGGNVNVSGTGVLHMASGLGTAPTDPIAIAPGGTITQSGGSVDVKDFTSTAGTPNGTYRQSGGTFKLYHDFKSSGTFSATGGTVEFAAAGGGGTWPSTTGPTQFFNVVNTVDPDYDGNGAVSFSVAGDWTSNAAVNMSGKAVTVTFNGTGPQTIGGTSTTTFRNVTLDKSSGTATLGANQTLTNGNLTVTAGTLDLSTYTMNRSSNGGVITVSNGAFLKLGGTNSFPTNYSVHTLGVTSTVEYGGANQTVTNESYGHLTLSGSGTKTMPASTLTLAGNFTMSGTCVATAAAAINTGGNFTVGANNTFTTGSFTHDLDGSFTNHGTFTATGSTFTLTGTSDQAIAGAATTTFNHLTVNKASTRVTLSTTTNVGGTLTFTSGNISTGSNTLILTSTGSVARTSGHVIGNLKKNVATGSNVSRTFEIGDASSYTPLTAVFASVSVTGDLTCSTTSGDHPNIATSDVNPSKSVNRYWTMAASGGLTFTTFNCTYTFVAGDVDGGAATSNFIARRWSGSAWSTTTIGTRTATSTQITSQSSTGDFQLGNVLSVAVSNSVFAFGTQPLNTWLTAQSSVITNDGTETEAIVARISTFTAGANTWTLSGTANGANQVRAQWSTTSAGGPWTDIANYATNFTVAASLAASATLTLYLRIQTPTSTASLDQYASSLTVTAQ